MKNSIVLKWFVLTGVLFTGVFLLFGLAQNYFFEKYYISKKINDLERYIQEFQLKAEEIGVEATSEELYKTGQIWITALNQSGQISSVEDYYIEVQLTGEPRTMKIPMYSFEGRFSSDVLFTLQVGDEVIIDTVTVGSQRIPYLIQAKQSGVVNLNIANRLHGSNADPAYQHLEIGIIKGVISKTVFPEKKEYIPFPYQEDLFLGQVKEFQARLLLNNLELLQRKEERSVTHNFVDYQIVIEPFTKDGVPGYIFAMTSLQPVDEALLVVRQFYPYFLGFTLLAIILLSFVFSRWLAKPLISINQITGQIANLDFSQKLPVHSNDEIGELSQNINLLSNQVEAYIRQLKKELLKEKQLENTRKEFIAGVSHELKTPLAVMKSCLSILQDGIVPEKSDYYFQALEDEIERMDLLVVNMLDLAKFESGTYKPDLSPFSLDKLIDEVCNSLSEQIRKKEISLVVKIKSELVLGHRTLIGRVLTNFLSNAIRHTEQGNKIVIDVKNEETIVEISVENQGQSVPEDGQKIWDQFYRGNDNAAKGGTGLGLAISKKILELHDSMYGVENTIDGVRFFFTLVTIKPL